MVYSLQVVNSYQGLCVCQTVFHELYVSRCLVLMIALWGMNAMFTSFDR